MKRLQTKALIFIILISCQTESRFNGFENGDAFFQLENDGQIGKRLKQRICILSSTKSAMKFLPHNFQMH